MIMQLLIVNPELLPLQGGIGNKARGGGYTQRAMCWGGV